MKRYSKWLVALFTGSALAVALAGCGPRHHSPEERAEWMMQKVSSELALDETQNAGLAVLKDEMLKARKAMSEQRKTSIDTVTALLQQPTLDRSQALTLVEGHTRVVNEQAPAVVAALGDFYDSLTPEQQTQLRERLQKFQDYAAKGRHHWH